MKKKLKICIIGKAPPIQGGVSRLTMNMAEDLARLGHQVWLITNADEAEPNFRMVMTTKDLKRRRQKFAGGGSLHVVSSQPEVDSLYVPWAKPFVSHLATEAVKIVKDKKCDLIFSYYFEPYGIVASLVSSWTKVPFVIAHAGSDLGGLFFKESLQRGYLEMLKSAKGVLTASELRPFFRELGIPKKNIYLWPPEYQPQHRSFAPNGPRLDINRFLKQALEKHPELHPAYHELSQTTFAPKAFTVGMYGKIHPAKGSYDLLEAIAILKRKRIFVQLVILGSETNSEMNRFLEKVRQLELSDRVWVLPFIPHDRVPEFIRATDVICFLERDFNISIHTPTVPLEVFRCGKCLVVSKQIRQSLTNLKNQISGESFLEADPKNHQELADAIKWAAQHRKFLKEIGRAGRSLVVTPDQNQIRKSMASLDQTFRDFVG